RVSRRHSARDRYQDQSPFIVRAARPVDELKDCGAIGIGLSWPSADPPPPDVARAVAPLCASHPGPAPVLLEYGGNGTQARLRSRSLRVAVADDLLAALRELLGAERVQLVKAT